MSDTAYTKLTQRSEAYAAQAFKLVFADGRLWPRDMEHVREAVLELVASAYRVGYGAGCEQAETRGRR